MLYEKESLQANTWHIFYFKKHAMIFLLYGNTSFESHENSHWFLKVNLLKVNVTPITRIHKKKQKFKVSLNTFVSRVKGQTEHNPWKIENLQKSTKCYKNRKITKLPSKKELSHEHLWKNALFIAN
jgi:hypothetical protein